MKPHMEKLLEEISFVSIHKASEQMFKISIKDNIVNTSLQCLSEELKMNV